MNDQSLGEKLRHALDTAAPAVQLEDVVRQPPRKVDMGTPRRRQDRSLQLIGAGVLCLLLVSAVVLVRNDRPVPEVLTADAPATGSTSTRTAPSTQSPPGTVSESTQAFVGSLEGIGRITDYAASSDSFFVAHERVGGLGAISMLDLKTGSVRWTAELQGLVGKHGMAPASDKLWVVTSDAVSAWLQYVRLDTGAVAKVVELGVVASVAVTDRYLYLKTEGVTEIRDVVSGAIAATIADSFGWIASDGQRVWMVDIRTRSLTTIEGLTSLSRVPLDVATAPSDVVTGNNRVYVVVGDSLLEVDPSTGAATIVVKYNGTIRGVAVSGAWAWIVDSNGRPNFLDLVGGRSIGVEQGPGQQFVTPVMVGDHAFACSRKASALDCYRFQRTT